MTVAVVGAEGFAGGALMGILVAAGEDCVPVNRGDPPPGDRLDAVIDCNGEGRRFWSNENPEESYRRSVATVESRLNAIDAGTYVYLSTVDVYGAGRTRPETSSEETTVDADALDTYSRHKYMAERLVLEKAARPLVLRCATLIGPGLRKNPVFDLLNGAPLRMTMESTMSLVHTATLGRVVQMLVASGAEGIFNVAASTPIAISDVQDAIAGELGMDPARMPVHAERISTYYDVNVERISEWMAMPTSLEALEIFLKRESTG